MTNPSQSTLKYVVNHATTALGLLAFWSIGFGDGPLLPSSYREVISPHLNRYSWESPSCDFYQNPWEQVSEDYRKMEIISNFGTKLIGDMEDLDPSYARIVSKKFWDLF
jgi:hypothetical protein